MWLQVLFDKKCSYKLISITTHKLV